MDNTLTSRIESPNWEALPQTAKRLALEAAVQEQVMNTLTLLIS